MINNLVLQGRFVKDVELKFTQQGKAVASSTIASQRNFKNANNEYESDFIPIVIWGKTAEVVATHFKKGNEILLAGRLQTRNYENNEGGKVYVTEMIVESFSFTSGNRDNQQSSSNNQQGNIDGMGKFGNSTQINIDDSQLPF